VRYPPCSCSQKPSPRSRSHVGNSDRKMTALDAAVRASLTVCDTVVMIKARGGAVW
jgi:hypothetical protein